jgi:hypothetical protein
LLLGPIRHLVREVVIPLANRAEKQLKLDTVAVLTFDVDYGESKMLVVPDEQGWINGSIRDIVAGMDTRYAHLLEHADGQDVREGVRKLLERLHRISLRGTGGVYFVPASVGEAATQLAALRNFIRGLERYRIGHLAPSCDVVTLRGEEAFQEIHATVRQSAVEAYAGRLALLRDAVEPVLAGRARGQIAAQINAKAVEEWADINAGLDAYRLALREGLAEMDELIRTVAARVQEATGSEVVRRVL